MSFDPSSYPYDTVVHITDQVGKYKLQGSGVLISPDEVLTASHVLYQEGIGTATNIVVTPAYDAGAAPYGSATGAYFHYNPVDDAGNTLSVQSSQDDYAVIHLSQPFAGLGTMGYGSGFAGGPASVSGYPDSANGAMVTSQQSVSLDPDYALIEGASLGEGSSGGPVWITNSNGAPEVVGLVSTATGTVGYDNLITSGEFNRIQSWVAQDDAPGAAPSASIAGLSAFDVTTQQTVQGTGGTYAGQVSGLQNQFVNVTSDDLNAAASTADWFISTGSGNDAIAAFGGSNVLDGGTGSNFLVGASGADGGTDTFFLDGRQSAPTWDTIVDFHPGDAATLWGYVPGQSVMAWAADDGAPGYTGATIHASFAGTGTPVNGSVTFAGVSLAAAQSQFAVSSGVSGGIPYLYVKDLG